MDDKFHDFFSENNFDVHEPISGHESRFMRKLQHPKKKTTSWKWMSIVASITLLLGFYLGSSHQKNQIDLEDISPKMAETQSYFTNILHQELKEVERFRNLDTESLIEDSLDEIEELEEQYNKFKAELNTEGNQQLQVKEMIANYQKRLQIIQRLLVLLQKLEEPTQLNNFEDEII